MRRVLMLAVCGAGLALFGSPNSAQAQCVNPGYGYGGGYGVYATAAPVFASPVYGNGYYGGYAPAYYGNSFYGGSGGYGGTSLYIGIGDRRGWGGGYYGRGGYGRRGWGRRW